MGKCGGVIVQTVRCFSSFVLVVLMESGFGRCTGYWRMFHMVSTCSENIVLAIHLNFSGGICGGPEAITCPCPGLILRHNIGSILYLRTEGARVRTRPCPGRLTRYKLFVSRVVLTSAR